MLIKAPRSFNSGIDVIKADEDIIREVIPANKIMFITITSQSGVCPNGV